MKTNYINQLQRSLSGWGETKEQTIINIEEMAANLADPNICKTDNWIAGAKEIEQKLLPIVKELIDVLKETQLSIPQYEYGQGERYETDAYTKIQTTLEKYKHII
jgi:hypothetical protein